MKKLLIIFLLGAIFFGIDYYTRGIDTLSKNGDVQERKTQIINGHKYDVTYIDSENVYDRPLIVSNVDVWPKPIKMELIFQCIEDEPNKDVIYKFRTYDTHEELTQNQVSKYSAQLFGLDRSIGPGGKIICWIEILQ